MEQRSGTLFEFLVAFEAVEGNHVITAPSSAARKRRLVSSRG